MKINASFVVLVIAAMALVYALLHLYLNSRETKQRRCRDSNKRARVDTEREAYATPPTPNKPWVWAAMAKWTTVRDMMKWKAEMNSLDNVISSI